MKEKKASFFSAPKQKKKILHVIQYYIRLSKKLMRKTETKNLRFRRLFFGKFNLYPCKYIVISIYIFGKMKTVLRKSYIVSKVLSNYVSYI